MKITAVETIPVSLPVGKFQDGDHKVRGVNAPDRYPVTKKLTRPGSTTADEHLILSNVIVKIHTDEGVTGFGEAACDTTEPVDVVRTMIDRHMGPRLMVRIQWIGGCCSIGSVGTPIGGPPAFPHPGLILLFTIW